MLPSEVEGMTLNGIKASQGRCFKLLLGASDSVSIAVPSFEDGQQLQGQEQPMADGAFASSSPGQGFLIQAQESIHFSRSHTVARQTFSRDQQLQSMHLEEFQRRGQNQGHACPAVNQHWDLKNARHLLPCNYKSQREISSF